MCSFSHVGLYCCVICKFSPFILECNIREVLAAKKDILDFAVWTAVNTPIFTKSQTGV